ncbi:MAG: paraquat-inducible protein A [Pseudomonadota bacterium]
MQINRRHLNVWSFSNLLLLVVYPVAWIAPLATAGVLPWFSGNEITIAQGVLDLWKVDPALSILVAVLAVIVPYAKTLAISAVQFEYLGPRTLPVIEVIGKLSMADIFLIALYIVVVKGVGIGHVTPAWGLWLFTLCVLGSIVITFFTQRQIKQSGRM